ncbi:MAG: EsaB/YukD family protein [Clostridiales bacterium]|nr:EsaB/YukD family protein [Clostridiales bacterium]
MDKILIQLTIPAVNREFDVFVPLDLSIGELTEIIVKGVEDLCDGAYIPSGNEMLNLRENRAPLNPLLTLYSYGIKDGEEIFLI